MKTRLLPLLVLLVPLLRAQPAIEFDQAQYIAQRGETVTITLSFNAPVPNGLFTYWLRLNHPEGVVDPVETNISVVPALDFLFFDPAQKTVTATHAEIRGTIEFQDPLIYYQGTEFLTIQLTLAENAPFGAHALTLSIPEPNSFVDGDLNVLDGTLILGTATLHVTPFADLNLNNVPDEWELDFYSDLEAVPETVEIQGVEFTIRELYIANLSPLGNEVPRFTSPTTYNTSPNRIYDLYHSTDLTDENGWTLVETHTGDGDPYVITDPQPGFYKFTVNLPPELD